MKRAGQVVIFKFPQANLEFGKPRPALLVAKLPGDYDDWLISMISTKTHQYIDGMDEIINQDSPDFVQSGLKAESIVRVSRVAVVSGDILLGTIGEISSERLTRVRNHLSDWLRTGEFFEKDKKKEENGDLNDELTESDGELEQSDDAEDVMK
jgi:mRNA interferase MazF